MFEAQRGELADFDFSGRSRPEIVDALAAAAQLRAALAGFEARGAAALEALGDRGAGASPVLRATSRSSQRAADGRARRAERLSTMPLTRAALSRGDLGEEHADVLGAAAEETSATEVESSGLLDRAAKRPADLFRREVREWVRARHESVDAAATEGRSEARQRRLRAARKALIFEGDDGMVVLHAEFDPVAGARVKKVVEAEADRRFHADGGRGEAGAVATPEQRRADALEALLTTGPPSTARRPPMRNQLVVVATLGSETGDITAGSIPGTGPIPQSALERLACGSDLTGALFSGEGQPLWLGDTTRLASDAQWLGLIARDGGCVGCGVDPSRCEAHHVIAWRPPGRGPTDIDNLVLLCSHHHHLVHDHGWVLRRTGQGWSLSPPRTSGAAA